MWVATMWTALSGLMERSPQKLGSASKETTEYGYTHIYVYTYTYIYIYVYIYLYVYVYVYIYIYCIWFGRNMSDELENLMRKLSTGSMKSSEMEEQVCIAHTTKNMHVKKLCKQANMHVFANSPTQQPSLCGKSGTAIDKGRGFRQSFES